MQNLNELLKEYQSVVLGTIGDNGYPFNSYAPYYYNGEKIYVFISDVATHASNMRATKKASAFFIEDENQSKNIFARRRISLQCDVEKISKNDASFLPIMEAFQVKFSAKMIQMLMGMDDFNLYELSPVSGEATFGFADAYTIEGEKVNQLVPRTGTKHS